MKKISPIIKKEEKSRAKHLLVGGLLIFVMFFSVFGYGFYNQEKNNALNKVVYNGFEFINQDNFWILNLENTKFVFRNNPNQVPRIDSKLNYLSSYSNKPLYVYSENRESELEIYTNMNYFAQRMQSACLQNRTYNCDEEWPIKNCDNNFIIIQNNSYSEIIQENGCVFITGPQENLTQITDEFLFKILEIEQ